MRKKNDHLDKWKLKQNKKISFRFISVIISLIVATIGLITYFSQNESNELYKQTPIYSLKSTSLEDEKIIISPQKNIELELEITQDGKLTNKYIVQALFFKNNEFISQKDTGLEISYSSFYSKPIDFIANNEIKTIKIKIDNKTDLVQTIKFNVQDYKKELLTNIVNIFYEGDFKITASIDGIETKYFPDNFNYDPNVVCKNASSTVDVMTNIYWDENNNKWQVSFKEIYYPDIECNIDFITKK